MRTKNPLYTRAGNSEAINPSCYDCVTPFRHIIDLFWEGLAEEQAWCLFFNQKLDIMDYLKENHVCLR